MNTSEILALFDRDERQENDFPHARKDLLPRLIRFVPPEPGMSFVLYTDLDESNADAVIEAQVDYFIQLGRPLNWKVFSHDRPADLVQRLAARGFEVDEPDAVMVLDIAAAPDSLLAQPLADIRRLTHRSQLTDVVAILESVWNENFDWVYERLGAHMEIPGYISVYVAYAEDAPASTGWIYFNKGHFASLWGGSTLAAYRGQGHYTALLAARAREARERGKRYLTIDAGKMSRPIVARHGFEVITYATDCTWKPASEDEKVK